MNTPENNLLTIITHQEVTTLYKTFLEVVEDIRHDNQVMINKIAEKYGPEFANMVNFFTQERYEHFRKRKLDRGNECERKLQNVLSFFEFIIDKDKVAEAAKQKRIIARKVVTGSITQIE